MTDTRPYAERRQTRVVFPSGDATRVWKTISVFFTAWVLWVSHCLWEMKTQVDTFRANSGAETSKKGTQNEQVTCRPLHE